MRLNELFEVYIEDVDLIQHDTSLDGMRYRYNSLIRNVFGEKELEDIDFKDIKRFQKEMVEGKYRTRENTIFSVSYINGVVQLLKRLLSYANMMDYADFSYEQLRGLKSIHNLKDKGRFKKQQIIWKISDFNVFLQYVDDEKYKALFNVLFYTGLRKGEAVSLCWKDVDLIEQTIAVTSTACRVKGKGQIVKEPKSKCSYRIVHINDSLNEMLLNLYLEEKEKYKTNINHHYVFGSYKMIAYTTLDRRFRKYKRVAGVSDMTLHGFRHSHATMMLELTNDVYNVSKRLGHESIEITDTYLHVNSRIQKEMAEQIEKAINDNRKSEYDSFLQRIKNNLKKELMVGNYSKVEMESIRRIYEVVRKSA